MITEFLGYRVIFGTINGYSPHPFIGAENSIDRKAVFFVQRGTVNISKRLFRSPLKKIKWTTEKYFFVASNSHIDFELAKENALAYMKMLEKYSDFNTASFETNDAPCRKT